MAEKKPKDAVVEPSPDESLVVVHVGSERAELDSAATRRLIKELSRAVLEID